MKFRLLKELQKAFRYVSDSRIHIVSAFLLFSISALAGFSFSSFFTFLDEILRELVSQTEGMNWIQLFLFIFKNNLLSALFALFFGLFFCVVPLFNAVINGVLLGYVASRAISFAGLVSLWRLLPHGFFELPAIFIAIGLGIKFGTSLFHSSPRKTITERFRGSLKVFLYIILPLLFVAALIEATLIFLTNL